MTTWKISNAIEVLSLYGVRDDESYNAALQLICLHDDYYFTDAEWNTLLNATYDYETTISEDF